MSHRIGPLLGLALLASTLSLTSPASSAQETGDCASDAERIAALEAYLAGAPGPLPVVERRLARLQARYADDCVALNQIQVLGTHNSYHQQPSDALYEFMHRVTPAVEAWQYSHLPLAGQFQSQGVRQIELDVYLDPPGQQFYFRLGPLFVGESPFGPPSLLLPGMKVLHVPHLDFETSCLSFVECLKQVRAWSVAHPSHLPLMILVETKGSGFDEPDAVSRVLLGREPAPQPFGSAEFDALDLEIRSVFPDTALFTPDDLRGSHATVEEAVLSTGWPTLGALRGKVMFAMDAGGSQRLIYLDGHPNLEGRVMFTNSTPGQPDAAFVKVNDPQADPSLIPGLVAAGYLVRTRADTDTEEARSGDTRRRDAALASGAQFVSTDFPAPSPLPGFSDYFVQIPGGTPARCNPVATSPGCRHNALERLR